MQATVGLFALAAACGPPWAVIRQATPSPFSPQSQFAVEGVRFDGLRVGRKSEAEWLASKKPESQASHAADKNEFSVHFVTAILRHGLGVPVTVAQPGAPPPQFYLRAFLTWFEPGFFAGVVSAAAEVRVHVQLADAAGQVLDEIVIDTLGLAVVPDTLGLGGNIRASTTERLRAAADDAGRIAARYLRWRVGLER